MSDKPQVTEILKPASTDELAAIVRQAASDGQQLRIRSAIPHGLMTIANIRNISLTNMKSVIDYPARDMTITVEAGMPISELTKTLQSENQQLPIDSFDQTASVGSVVAGDISGPRQYGYGTIRDYVIGIEAVDGQGRIFHAGGRVVKNVAGYDLCRLMVGSRGMLGILTHVTFKLKPIPSHTMLRTFRFDDVVDFENALERLNTSAATPVVLDFTYSPPEFAERRSTDTTDKMLPYSLAIGVEGTETSCLWQVQQLRSECAGSEEIHFDGQPGGSVYDHCRSWGYGWNEPKITCLPSRIIPIAAALAKQDYSTIGHAGNGTIFIHGKPGDGDVRKVCDEVVAVHGGTVCEWDKDYPANSKDELTTRLRAAFDPNCVFTQ